MAIRRCETDRLPTPHTIGSATPDLLTHALEGVPQGWKHSCGKKYGSNALPAGGGAVQACRAQNTTARGAEGGRG